jgi:hypothetical protein
MLVVRDVQVWEQVECVGPCVGHSGARIRKIPTGRRIGRTTYSGARIQEIPTDRPTDRRIGGTTYSLGLVRLENRFFKKKKRVGEQELSL